MGDNMVPYIIAVGDKHSYFLSKQYVIIEIGKIEMCTLLNDTNDSRDPVDYHLAKYGENSFEKPNYERIHTYYSNNNEEDIWIEEEEVFFEPNYCNGSNDVKKIFIQNNVICS